MPTFLGYQRVVVVRFHATHNGILFSWNQVTASEHHQEIPKKKTLKSSCEFRKKKARCCKARNGELTGSIDRGRHCLGERLKNLEKRLESANTT